MATGSDPGNVAVDVQAGPAPVPAQLTTAAKGCIGGFALVGVMLLFTDMFLVFMYLWNFAPLYVLLARARSDQNAADRSEIITKFGTGFIVGPFILFTALFIAGSIASFLPDGFAYYFLSCAVIVLIVVAIEEAVKLTMIHSTYKQCTDLSTESEMRLVRSGLYTSAALASGYAVMSGWVAFLRCTIMIDRCLAALIINVWYVSPDIFTELVVTIWALLLYVPIHVLTGILIGIDCGRHVILHAPIRFPTSLSVSFTVRAIHLIVTFLLAAYIESPWGAVAAIFAFSLAICALLYVFVRWYNRQLPQTYLQSAAFQMLL